MEQSQSVIDRGPVLGRMTPAAVAIIALVAGIAIGLLSARSGEFEFYELHGDVVAVNASGTVMSFTQEPVAAPEIGRDGTQGFQISDDVSWRFNDEGTWRQGTAPECLQPLRPVNDVTIGVLHGFNESSQRGYSLLLWVVCP